MERNARRQKNANRNRKRKQPKYIGDGNTLISRGDHKSSASSSKQAPIAGGVKIPGFGRRGSILRAVANRKPLNIDGAGNLVPQISGSMRGSGGRAGNMPPGTISRAPSIRGGALRNELWKFAASVDNKVKV